jgi:hypothetical protein
MNTGHPLLDIGSPRNGQPLGIFLLIVFFDVIVEVYICSRSYCSTLIASQQQIKADIRLAPYFVILI